MGHERAAEPDWLNGLRRAEAFIDKAWQYLNVFRNHLRQMVQYMSPALGMAYMHFRRRQALVGQHEIGFIAARIEFEGYQRIHMVRQRGPST
jgi:hypothetical protein